MLRGGNYMLKEIYDLLDHYSFFQDRNGYMIHEIQNYGRNSKFMITFQNEVYLVLVSKKRIQKYIPRLSKLGNDYKELIEFRYLSEDHNVLVLNYYGGIGGHDLSYFSKNQTPVDSEQLSQRLYNLIQSLHSKKSDYIDFDENGTTWYEYILYELTKTLDESYHNKAITKIEYNKIMECIKLNRIYFEQVETCYIHGDLTIVNICYNQDEDKLYLIDYDDFTIGDPFFDFSRIMNFADESAILKKFKEQYFPNIEDNIIHTIYTLRVTLNWYNFIIKRNLTYDLPVLEIRDLMEKVNLFLNKSIHSIESNRE